MYVCLCDCVDVCGQNRCDQNIQVVTKSRCHSCSLTSLVKCPDDYTKRQPEKSTRDCRYVFMCAGKVLLLSGIKNSSKWFKSSFIYYYTLYYIIFSIYTAAHKFGISKILNVFKEVSSAHQGCIYSIKNTEKTVILWNLFQFLILVSYFNIL